MKFSRYNFLFFLALRYSKGRSPFLRLMILLSTLGVMVGVGALIVVLSVMTGIRAELKRKILAGTPHILITKMGGVIDDWENTIRKIEEIRGVKGVFPLVVGNAILKKNGLTTSVVVQCIPAPLVQKALDFTKFIKKGEIFSDGKINVGIQLAKNIDLKIGDKVTLVSPYGDATLFGFIPNTAEVEVTGIVEVGIFDWDSVFVFMTLKTCDELFDTKNWVTSIAVQLNDPDDAEEISEVVQRTLKYPYVSTPWTRMQKNLFAAMQLEKVGMTLILTLIIVVASFNILSTITILVREKAKDIAVMKTFGITSSEIKKIFLGVGLWIAGRGIILGTILGLTISYLISKYEIIHLPEDVYYISRLPADVNLKDVLLSWAIALTSSFFASYFPVSRAVKSEPFDILRREV